MKPFFTLYAMLVTLVCYSQPIVGDWKGDLDIQGMKLPLVLHITPAGDSFTATMDSPAQGAKGIKADTTEWINGQFSLVINNIRLRYVGKLVGADSIAGTFTQMNTSLPLGLARIKDSAFVYNRPQTPRPKFNYKGEDVTIKNEEQGNLLAGTLTTPYHKSNFPVVVMITGSGAQDRDETLFEHKPFLVIADHLTNNGIGVLRMDDRGVGGSEKGKENATSADFATDISSAVNFLVKKGYKKIGLVGHSEGGMIAPMVAVQNKNVKFIVTMAGPGIPVDSLMLIQNREVSKTSGVSAEKISENIAASREIFSLLKNYSGNDIKTALKTKLKTWLDADTARSEDQKEKFISQQIVQVTSPWFLYFIKFNPDIFLSQVKVPVLAINGAKDVQVAAKENLSGIEKSLQKAGNKNFEVVELPGLNHLFQEAKTGAVSEYATIEQTISPTVLKLMTDWILKITKQMK